ncbi:MAG: hypothetical protein A2X36_08635 [Elusimicrobia bacterium GWA2_69_24]|nr:MAG: hypothetical protein A2X36_08635 [Elusimicrobia bacterium GWA2_69_24]
MSSALILLAWRNVWRNRRRTLITLLSIAAGLAALLFGQSLVYTIQYQLVEKATGVHTGHIQILEAKTADFKFPDRYIPDPGGIEKILDATPEVAVYERRVVVTGMISSKKEAAGVLLCGVDPERDPRVLQMSRYLKRGRLLGPDGEGVYLGDKLAAKLGVNLGDEVVLMGSARDGSMGAELQRVTGIFSSGSQTFDASIIYVSIKTASRLMALGDEVNDFVIRVRDPMRLDEARDELARRLRGRPVRVVTWEQVDFELVGIRDYQNALLDIVLCVIFLIVSLGILNTLLMSLFERVREFGVLMAIGAGPRFIRRMILLESGILGALGGALGLAAGCAIILYYRKAGFVLPVGESIGFFMPFDSVLFLRFDWGRHVTAGAAVLLTSVLSGLPPAFRASRMKPAESLRHI